MRVKKTTKKSGYKIGLYVRVSTEEQAENPEGSIKNQEQRLRDYVRLKNLDSHFGDVKELFCDPGISAKDMNRPALQRMLSSIRSGEIDLVLVTEISRLSRSIKDFTHLWEFLKDHACEFQSLRDNFDTTTPAGEMILFTLANFAQFERRQLGERIQNSFQARAQRGLWNGGVLPLGYEAHPEKPGHLRINPEEEKIVRRIFLTFLEQETLSKAGKALNEAEVRLPRLMRKGGSVRHAHFTIGNLYGILTNRAYIGKRVFKTKDGEIEVSAVWPAIVDEMQFLRVQKMLAGNKDRKKSPSERRFPYLLSGLLVCAKCGDRLCGKSAHGNGGKIGYYEHTLAVKTQNCLSKKVLGCTPNRLPARVIEAEVWADMQRLLSAETYARQIFEEARKLTGATGLNIEIQKLRAKCQSIDLQIEAVTERIGQLPKEIDAKVFFEQIMKLQKAKAEIERQIVISAADGRTEKVITFDHFEAFRNKLVGMLKGSDPNVMAAICRRVIDRIEINASQELIQYTIFYHVGETHYRSLEKGPLPETTDKGRMEAEKSAGSRPLPKYGRERVLSEAAGTVEKSLSVGSNSLFNGSERRT